MHIRLYKIILFALYELRKNYRIKESIYLLNVMKYSAF